MLDIHTHLLPDIDDGSADIRESAAMLRAMSASGITDVVATPHFYLRDNTVKEFLQRRSRAALELSTVLEDAFPKVYLGAEVAWFPGISAMPELPELCIRGTKTLLLEMPFQPWDGRILRELSSLENRTDLTVVLAHIERYLPLQKPSVRKKIFQSNLYLQMNAGCLLTAPTMLLMLPLLEKHIAVLGSDCHGMMLRRPCLGQAMATLKAEDRGELAQRLQNTACQLLRGAIPLRG